MEILCYTREPKEDHIYAARLAYSMHLAYRAGESEWVPFHHNEGLLYAKAVHREDGTLTAKSLKKPWLFETKEGIFGVAAIRVEAEGEPDVESEGCVLLWSSCDLVHFQERGLLRLQEEGQIEQVRCMYEKETGQYRIEWERADGVWMGGRSDNLFEREKKIHGEPVKKTVDFPELSSEEIEEIEGIRPGNAIQISEEKGDYLLRKLLPPRCMSMELTTSETGYTIQERDQIRAIGNYSDGTQVVRRIDWESGGDDKTNNHTWKGRVHQEHFDFPFAEHRADPCCMYWHGKYYYIATNDFDENKSLYIRCSDQLEGLVEAKEELLLDTEMYPDIKGLLWAPEFHEINGRLYIFHAATEGEFFFEESRVMILKEGGDPMRVSDWSKPKLVIKKDGTPLCEAGKVISLDMTVFLYEGKVYAMWSQRQFLPVDQGAWLYLAEIDGDEPWKLLSDPVCIAKPEYGWENNHTFVVEGPFALKRGEDLFVTYSGAAVDTTYAVGLLKPKRGADLLNSENWEKSNYPLLSSRSCSGQYGPGHNSYLEDENGLVWNFYHARAGVDAPRSSGARRVHFDIDQEPMLDVLEEFDLPEEFREVSISLDGV